MDTLMQVLEKEPLAPRQLNPAIEQDLQTITLKCLQKEAASRYGSARELSQELGRFVNGEPIQARPISVAEKGIRWCRRKPATAAMVGLLVVAFALITAGGYFAAFRMNQLRNTADEQRSAAELLAGRNRELAETEARQRMAAKTQKRLAEEKQAEAERLVEQNRQQLVSTRLMQADSLPAGEQVEEDWQEIRRRNPEMLSVRQQQIVSWYDTLLKDFESNRDWSALTFHAEHFLRLRPDDGSLWEKLANAYGEMGQFDKTVKYLKKLAEKNPGNNWWRYLKSAREFRHYFNLRSANIWLDRVILDRLIREADISE